MTCTVDRNEICVLSRLWEELCLLIGLTALLQRYKWKVRTLKMRNVLTYAWMVSHNGYTVLLAEHLVGRHVLLFWLVPQKNRTG